MLVNAQADAQRDWMMETHQRGNVMATRFDPSARCKPEEIAPVTNRNAEDSVAVHVD